jgi:SAM-dependent methyltransferase
MNDPIEQARDEAMSALEHFRQALTRYKQAAGEPPLFLLEKPAPELPQAALGACRVYATRHAMMRDLVRGGTGGEVGVQHGHFSRFLLDEIAPEHLHLFDMSDRMLRPDVRNDPRVVLHVGDSSKRLDHLPAASFDWIYIDGDHSYAGVCRDTVVAKRKLRPEGLLIFNDYTPWSPGEAMSYGVMACVNETVRDGWQMVGLALTSNGYFDVALRRG